MIRTKNKHSKQIFVCCNEKKDGSGCATLGSEILRDELKMAIKEKGLNEKIRVVKSGCLDYCKQGIAAVIYPEGETFLELNLMDKEMLLNELQKDI